MTDRKTVRLVGPLQRKTAHAYVDAAPDGYVVTISPPTRRSIQNAKFHAQIGDIAKQTTYAGKKWDADDMKRILIDEFAEAMRQAGSPLHHDGRLVPSEDGRRVIQLGIQSSEFRVAEAAQFVDFLYAWGIEREVVWTEPAIEELPC